MITHSNLSTLVLTAMLITLTACGENRTPSESAEQSSSPPAHTTATTNLPDKLPVADLAGIEKMIQDTAAQDRVLVIDFWATWCPPCVAQFPMIHEGLLAIGKEQVRPVTITFDSPGKLEKQAITFLNKNKALDDAYIIAPDTDSQIAIVDALGDQWTDLVVPAVFVFDKQGKLVGQYFNGPDEVPAMLEQVRKLTQG